MEHRHELPAERLAQLRPRRADQARRALRVGRRVRRRHLQAVGGLAGRRTRCVQDRDRGIHADYDKVHRINHVGPRYAVEGPHLVSPSPQRTPLLFQAGASEAGRTFAARNAEAVFIQSPNLAAAARDTADIRARAVAHGRRSGRHQVLPGPLRRARVDRGGGAAQRRGARRVDRLRRAALAHVRRGRHRLRSRGPRHAGRRAADRGRAEHRRLDQGPGRRTGPPRCATSRTTPRRTAGSSGRPSRSPTRWRSGRQAGVDGINLVNAEIPGSYEDFVDHVVPVLQQRGLAQREYAPGTLRNKLFGQGDRLPDRHPATRYRGAFAPQPV